MFINKQNSEDLNINEDNENVVYDLNSMTKNELSIFKYDLVGELLKNMQEFYINKQAASKNSDFVMYAQIVFIVISVIILYSLYLFIQNCCFCGGKRSRD